MVRALHSVHFVLYRAFPPALVLAVLCILAFNGNSTCTIPNFLTGTWSVPRVNCGYCSGVKEPKLFHESNVSIAHFMSNFAFGSGPILFKGASKSWPATTKFSYNFFRDMYMKARKNSRAANNNVDRQKSEQYFSYRSSLFTLQEFLSLSEAESINSSWYISWSVLIFISCVLSKLILFCCWFFSPCKMA